MRRRAWLCTPARASPPLRAYRTSEAPTGARWPRIPPPARAGVRTAFASEVRVPLTRSRAPPPQHLDAAEAGQAAAAGVVPFRPRAPHADAPSAARAAPRRQGEPPRLLSPIYSSACASRSRCFTASSRIWCRATWTRCTCAPASRAPAWRSSTATASRSAAKPAPQSACATSSKPPWCARRPAHHSE